jgi:hypothetical protein
MVARRSCVPITRSSSSSSAASAAQEVGEGRSIDHRDASDLARIDELLPLGAARGERYPEQFMADLDSQR